MPQERAELVSFLAQQIIMYNNEDFRHKLMRVTNKLKKEKKTLSGCWNDRHILALTKWNELND